MQRWVRNVWLALTGQLGLDYTSNDLYNRLLEMWERAVYEKQNLTKDILLATDAINQPKNQLKYGGERQAIAASNTLAEQIIADMHHNPEKYIAPKD